MTQPLVSVLMPVRERYGWMMDSIRSLWAEAAEPGRVEILVRIDKDDGDLIGRVNDIPDGVRIVIGPRGKGYLDLHTMYNELTRLSTGKWLWLFNDDMRVVTRHWDNLLAAHQPTQDCALLNVGQTDYPVVTVAPIVLAQFHQSVIRRLSASPANDHWLQDLYRDRVGLTPFPQIVIEHRNNAHGAMCKTRQEAIAASEPALGINYSPEVQAEFRRDVDAMRRHCNLPFPPEYEHPQ